MRRDSPVIGSIISDEFDEVIGHKRFSGEREKREYIKLSSEEEGPDLELVGELNDRQDEDREAYLVLRLSPLDPWYLEHLNEFIILIDKQKLVESISVTTFFFEDESLLGAVLSSDLGQVDWLALKKLVGSMASMLNSPSPFNGYDCSKEHFQGLIQETFPGYDLRFQYSMFEFFCGLCDMSPD